MKLWSRCGDSFLCVEYFFIIAGFFLFFHVNNKNDETMTFALNKLVRLWPLFAFSLICIWLLSLFHFVDFYTYSNVLNLFMLYRTGIFNGPVNNMHSWFICVLFWCSIFYHYVFRCMSKKLASLVIGIIVLYSYTAILNWHSGVIPGVHTKIILGFSGALLRGCASIGLGIFLGMFWDKIGDSVKKFGFKNKLKSALLFSCASALEIYLFVFLINNSIFHRIHFKNNFIFIIVFCSLFLLFLARKGLLSKLLENDLSVFLGKFSYSIYIMQAVGFVFVRHCFWENKAFVVSHPYVNIFITICICTILGVLSHIFVEDKINKYCKGKLKSLS